MPNRQEGQGSGAEKEQLLQWNKIEEPGNLADAGEQAILHVLILNKS